MNGGPYVHRAAGLLADLAVLLAALWVAFALRFDGAVPPHMLERAVVAAPYVVALQYGALHLFSVPRFAWRFVGLPEVLRILGAVGASATILVAARLAAGAALERAPSARFAALPLGVLGIDALLAFVGVSGARVLRRVLAERRGHHPAPRPPRRAILIGAGEAGFAAARTLAARPDLALEPVGFLDDDPARRGTLVHRLPVLGAVDDLPRVAAALRVEEALLTLGDAPGTVARRALEACQRAGLAPRVLPGHAAGEGAPAPPARLRALSIEDLLRREPVAFDEAAVARLVRGRVVLVTGAGGTIGAELCRQLARLAPARLVCAERAENALFEVERALAATPGGPPVEAHLADVGDEARLGRLFEATRPAVVFHAAAHKHVALVEANPGEAIKNNVLATRTLARLALARGVEALVLISSDKAVQPTSAMGASKRLAERCLHALAGAGPTRLLTVRFGNVLGSSGSVVPIFRAQVEAGGPVTVTHPDATRYFMTIPEACRLVLQAAAMGRDGEAFVLDMGAPVRILDLAHDVIRLSGLVPGRDVEVAFVGLRPGEKLHERLLDEGEAGAPTDHPKVLRVERPPPPARAAFDAALERLAAAADGPPDVARAALFAALAELEGRAAG